MGVCSSKSTVHAEPMPEGLAASKGGSMLVRGGSAPSAGGTRQADGIGPTSVRNKEGWRPGMPIRRPPKMKAPKVMEVNTDFGAVRVRYGYKSLQGHSGLGLQGLKPNQDNLVALDTVDTGLATPMPLFGVFDGHGPYGEHASNFCRLELAPALAAQPAFPTDLPAAYHAAFVDVHQRFCAAADAGPAGVDPGVSGCTCITVLMDGGTLRVANLGDSRVVLGRATTPSGGAAEAVQLSDDHKPDREDERARIVANSSCAVIKSEAEIRPGGSADKLYICKSQDGMLMYGVMFTRSVGDLDSHLHLGVSEEPELTEHKLSPLDRLLVLASDGVWDYMSNEDVVQLAAVYAHDPVRAAEALVRRAKQLWDMHDQDGRRDDITVVVVTFEPLGQADPKAAPEPGSPAASKRTAPPPVVAPTEEAEEEEEAASPGRAGGRPAQPQPFTASGGGSMVFRAK